jgi:hypothetical protein
MLTLSASDKGVESVGRFGLGFKSVFLIADRPAVLSQDLAFSVVGGVYPMRLEPDGDAPAQVPTRTVRGPLRHAHPARGPKGRR